MCHDKSDGLVPKKLSDQSESELNKKEGKKKVKEKNMICSLYKSITKVL